MLDASSSEISILANNSLNLQSEVDSVSVVAKKSVSLVGDEDISVKSKDAYFDLQLGNFMVKSGNSYFKSNNFFVNNRFSISGPVVTLNGSLSVRGNGVFFGGLRSVRLGAQDVPEGNDIPLAPHFGHIGILTEDDVFTPPDNELFENFFAGHFVEWEYKKAVTEITPVVYRFDDSSHTFTTSYADDKLYRPYAQDFLYSFGASDYPNHEEWNLNTAVLGSGARVDHSSYPWPGSPVKKELIHPNTAGEDLRKPSNKDEWQQTTLQEADIKRKVRKPN